MKGIFLVSFFLLASIYQTTSLQCFTCNIKEGKCEGTPQLKVCSEDKLQSCFSININSTNAERHGFAKGCADVDKTVTDYCDYFKETLAFGESLLECSTCSSEGCNETPFKTRVAAQPLSCYTCNKKADFDKCVDPNSGLKPTLAQCSNLPICVTLVISSSNPDLDGISRGCADAPLGTTVPDDYCDYIRQNMANSDDKLLECAACNTAGCNTHTFTDTRADNRGSSFEILLTMVPLLLACILLTR